MYFTKHQVVIVKINSNLSKTYEYKSYQNDERSGKWVCVYWVGIVKSYVIIRVGQEKSYVCLQGGSKKGQKYAYVINGRSNRIIRDRVMGQS